MATFIKTPSSTLDYTINYDAYLNANQTIQTSTWAIPSALTEESSSFTESTCTIFLSGGSIGKKYQVTNTITYIDGESVTRTDSRQITIAIANRED